MCAGRFAAFIPVEARNYQLITETEKLQHCRYLTGMIEQAGNCRSGASASDDGGP